MATTVTVTTDVPPAAGKDAPPLSTLGGEASSSTLPVPATIASTTDEKSGNPPLTSTTEFSSSIHPVAAVGQNSQAVSTMDMSSQQHNLDPSAQPDSSELTDEAAAEAPSVPTRPKSLSITLLLISGAKYPFVINSEYMTRHNLTVTDQDPMQITVSALKECIWKEWKDDEWNVKPPSANFIRLIYFGRLLDDRQQLKDYRLNPGSLNVVHMTVRPAESGDDDATQRSTKIGFGGRDRDRGERSSPSCRCVIL